MPRKSPYLCNSPEDTAAANKQHRTAKPTWAVEVAEEGRRLAEILADEMSPDVLLRRACERRGRSVLAVKAERDRVLKWVRQ